MTNSGQFDGVSCEACEAMCLDAVDGTLTAAEQVVLDLHVAECVACAEQLSAAKRGAAWMEMLKEHRPEPSPMLLQRILAQTSEAPAYIAAPVPVPQVRSGFWQKVAAVVSFDGGQARFQPRLAMTAAMAFFSIALTLNLGGVRLSDLRPGAIQRSIADARASATRSFQSMKVVYQVESRVNELRDDNVDPGGPFGNNDEPKQQAPSTTAPQDDKAKGDEKPKGSSELVRPALALERVSDISNQ